LLSALDSAKSILGDLRAFNKDSWVVRYPQLQEQSQTSDSALKRFKTPRRSLSFADDPTFQTDVFFSPGRKGLTRSLSLADVPESTVQEESRQEGDASVDYPTLLSDLCDFSILRLDLKLGSHGSSTSASSLVSQLEKSSIAKLIDEQIGTSMNHVDKLRHRVEDTSSKVLVTGDLNAGKSTFVNAILGRSIMPIDQQPCTTAFCEVHDAAENAGKEEVHIIRDTVIYNVDDESTFSRTSIAELENFISNNDNEKQVIKVYLSDPRSPAQSLLHNGIVDISLIDAPGLNRDSLKTTAVFSRQEEIDVIVFVVSAENHFTLSAREFLTNASNDKAYLFIVVNKFDAIRDKNKCRRLVLEQIRQLSPSTYEDADDLVHFVDSASSLDPDTANSSFTNLESALRSFVLTKRAKSKLQPASTYLTRLLSDVGFLVSANAIVAQSEADRAQNDLKKTRPVLEKLQSGRETLEEGLETVEVEGASKAHAHTKVSLNEVLRKVEQGKSSVQLPTYPGVFGVWEWAGGVRRALLATLDLAVKAAEDDARVITTGGVNQISQLGDQYLPQGFERSRRVFMPEAMFSVRANARNTRRRNSTVVAGGVQGVGIGLLRRSDILTTSFFDLFDIHHQIAAHFHDAEKTEESGPSTFGVVSVSLGALTMVGGKALGLRGFLEGAVRVCHLLDSGSTRKWIAPVVGAFAIGFTGYLILELPHSIPRTIGRRIKSSLTVTSEEEGDQTWVDEHAARIERETRKVLRLAAWDQKEKFKAATDENEKVVRGAEDMKERANNALEWFGKIQIKTGEVMDQVREVTHVQSKVTTSV
jgi:mitofusin 2